MTAVGASVYLSFLHPDIKKVVMDMSAPIVFVVPYQAVAVVFADIAVNIVVAGTIHQQ